MPEGKQRRLPNSEKTNRISPAGLIYQNDTCCMQLYPSGVYMDSLHMLLTLMLPNGWITP